VVGGDVQGIDALRLHVPHEVGEVAAVGFHGMVREQNVGVLPASVPESLGLIC
jgi:hypothetical protein